MVIKLKKLSPTIAVASHFMFMYIQEKTLVNKKLMKTFCFEQIQNNSDKSITESHAMELRSAGRHK